MDWSWGGGVSEGCGDRARGEGERGRGGEGGEGLLQRLSRGGLGGFGSLWCRVRRRSRYRRRLRSSMVCPRRRLGPPARRQQRPLGLPPPSLRFRGRSRHSAPRLAVHLSGSRRGLGRLCSRRLRNWGGCLCAGQCDGRPDGRWSVLDVLRRGCGWCCSSGR